MRGLHGGGSSNNTHIGFEICEDGLSDPAYFSAVYSEAVELCVYLCKQFNLTEKNIICHCEGYKQGIASNHCDVMHWFPKHGKSMDTFRADVKAGLAVTEESAEESKPTDTEKLIWDKLYGFLCEELQEYADVLRTLKTATGAAKNKRAAFGETFLDKYDAQLESAVKTLYRVQVCAYSIKANADAMLERVKAAGFADALIKYSE